MTPRRSRQLCFIAGLLVCCALPHTNASAEAAHGASHQLAQASALLDSLHLEEAEKILAEVDAAEPNTPSVLWDRAMLDFYRGDYQSAVERSKDAIARAEDHLGRRHAREHREVPGGAGGNRRVPLP